MSSFRQDMLSALLAFDIVKQVEQHRAEERQDRADAAERTHQAFREAEFQLFEVALNNIGEILDGIQEDFGFSDGWKTKYVEHLMDILGRIEYSPDTAVTIAHNIHFHRQTLVSWYNRIEAELDCGIETLDKLQQHLDFPDDWKSNYCEQLIEHLEPWFLIPGAPDQTEELVGVIHFQQQKLADWYRKVAREWGHLRGTLSEIQKNLRLADDWTTDMWGKLLNLFEPYFCAPRVQDRSDELIEMIRSNRNVLIEWHNKVVSANAPKESKIDDWGET